MIRPYNFSAGPAALPQSVLEKAASEMLNWQGSGMGVMEMSHRGKEFISIYDRAEANLRALLSVPSQFKILFMQGGGLGENAIAPMNLCKGETIDFVLTGSWSEKSAVEAAKYAPTHIAASSKALGYTALPEVASWQLSKKQSYVHICTNETIHGIEFSSLPDLKALGCDAPLVIDCSSHILSRSIDWSRVGVAFAGAQKNIGPAGLTIVFVRDDLLDRALPITPSAFHYATVAANGSMYNTPPTYSIYMAGLVFEWLIAQGGVSALEARNIEKAQYLYDYIDQSTLYENRVAHDCRSRMNVTFYLKDESLNGAFLDATKAAGLLQLKGHKSVGGMRASIYNATPLAGVHALVASMREFESHA